MLGTQTPIPNFLIPIDVACDLVFKRLSRQLIIRDCMYE